GRLLTQLGWITSLPYEILYENTDGYQLGEHIIKSQVELGDDVQFVSYNGSILKSKMPTMLSIGDRIVLYAKQSDHLVWAKMGSFDAEDVSV
ncbi:MAG: hypothetical protein V7695_08060, partial [Sulfitobacter sp.]